MVVASQVSETFFATPSPTSERGLEFVYANSISAPPSTIAISYWTTPPKVTVPVQLALTAYVPVDVDGKLAGVTGRPPMFPHKNRETLGGSVAELNTIRPARAPGVNEPIGRKALGMLGA